MAQRNTDPIVKRALVIGGGVAGIRATLDIADGGYEAVLVEKTPSIGGHMIQISETFPTLDCPQCIETPWMVECGQHPNIRIMGYSEVTRVTGEVGHFCVTVKRKASYVDWDRCTGCDACSKVCPVAWHAPFERGVARMPAIYKPFAQAVPNKVVIEKSVCCECMRCVSACEQQAIDHGMVDRYEDIDVGAVVVATGYELLPVARVPEFEDDPDVIDGLQFERILCPSGPSAGVIYKPSAYQKKKRPFQPPVETQPKDVVFISCVGSRDPAHGLPYCSRVCCMYLAKMAMLYKHAVPQGRATVFYMDIRAAGKGYEAFVQRVVEENDVVYLRGRVSRVFRDGDRIAVWGMDTLAGKRVEIAADLVVLGTAMVPSPGSRDLAETLGIETDAWGFMQEAHLKFRPFESSAPGIFLAGTIQGPRDIPDCVAHASSAAGQVLALFARDGAMREEAAGD